jgi:HD superfamily phosphodiesterase
MAFLKHQRTEQIGAFVKERLEKVGSQQAVPTHQSEYRWKHTLKVTTFGKCLSEAVLAGCLLDDVSSFDPGEERDHGKLRARMACSLLAAGLIEQ